VVDFRCTEDVANHGLQVIVYPIRALYGGVIQIKVGRSTSTAVFAVDVYIDGVFVGTATYGLTSPGTVVSRHPSYAANAFAGFSFDFDTTTISNGRHSILVKVRDTVLSYSSIGEFDIRVANPNP
jgi:hypothetical protein